MHLLSCCFLWFDYEVERNQQFLNTLASEVAAAAEVALNRADRHAGFLAKPVAGPAASVPFLQYRFSQHYYSIAHVTTLCKSLRFFSVATTMRKRPIRVQRYPSRAAPAGA